MCFYRQFSSLMNYLNNQNVATNSIVSLWCAMIVIMSSPAKSLSEPNQSLSCQFNGQVRTCLVALNGDNLRLQLDDERVIQIDKRGNCRNRTEKGVKSRSCSARISWTEDFVYGLVIRRSDGGTTITSPEFEIVIPDLLL